MMEKKRLGRKSARRRVRTRTALFLYAGSVVGLMLLQLLAIFAPSWVQVWLSAADTLLFAAFPAYLGLAVIDADQRHLLMRRRLSGAQALWLCASGALLVCPATLLGDIGEAVLRMMGVQSAAAQSEMSVGALLPIFMISGVLAPICEELFFRGYLFGVFSRRGEAEAVLLTSALFAVPHGPERFLLAFLLGLLFAAVMLHTGSLLASLMLHMAYNMALIVLSVMPSSSLFVGLTPLSCIVRLCGCAALFYTMKRAWLARGARQSQEAPLRLSRREIALLAAAVLLVILAQVFSGVMGL